MYEKARGKKRIVVGGSHGKTTTTAMIMHALRAGNIPHDYLVGSSLSGYETMVDFSEESEVAVFEGDEYLTSPLDPRPKFHLYKPHIALLTGVAWDHMNVFPTWENYRAQFEIFAGMIEQGGTYIYYKDDEVLRDIAGKLRDDIEEVQYSQMESVVVDGVTFILYEDEKIPVPVFGRHNLQNMAGAWEVCRRLGMDKDHFLESMKTFRGAGKRLEIISRDDESMVFRDFAHAPSKVEATVKAVKEQYPGRMLYACLELHTFSSLNSQFLPQYAGSMDAADEAVVFYNPEVVKHKKLPEIFPSDIRDGFRRKDLIVYSDLKDLEEWYNHAINQQGIVLMMSSGNFGGLDLQSLRLEA